MTAVIFRVSEDDTCHVDDAGRPVDLVAASLRSDGSAWPMALLLPGATVFADDVDDACLAADPDYALMDADERHTFFIGHILAGRVALSPEASALFDDPSEFGDAAAA